MDQLAQRLSRAVQFSSRPRKRSGCLGCLPRFLLLIALGCVAFILITAVFAPWGFYLGGGFHILPYWQGWGTLQTTSGKYAIFVRFQPRPSGSRIMPGPSVGGAAYLCTPRGERFYMKLGGGMRRGIGLSTDGEKISLYMSSRSSFWANLNSDYRPRIELRGQWHNPNIVMDDHGSISRAFEPDGTVSSGHDAHRPYPGPIVPVTLVPGPYSDFEAACKVR
jgi:hypothetical protein